MTTRIGGIAEIADKLRVNPQSVRNWAGNSAMKFPKPLAKLSMGKVYDVDQAVAWFRKRRADPRRRKTFGSRYFL